MATWVTGFLEPGGLYLQNQKIGVYNQKTKLLTGITFPIILKASNPDLHKCVRTASPLKSNSFIRIIFI